MSVIDARKNEVLSTVNVGRTVEGIAVSVSASPRGIAVNPETNLIYVLSGSDTVSIIDGKKNEAILGVIFNINPADSGHISCIDGGEIPTNEYRKIKV